MDNALASLLNGAITVFIALIFARAALHKATEFTEFTGFVADYRLVPQHLVGPVSLGLVGAEVLTVLLLLVPGGQPFGLGLGVLMFTLYAGAMAVNIRRGRTHIECGCGGTVQPLGWALVGRNGVLVLVTLLAIVTGPPLLDLGGTVTVIVSGIAAWAVFLLAEQILANSSLARLTR